MPTVAFTAVASFEVVLGRKHLIPFGGQIIISRLEREVFLFHEQEHALHSIPGNPPSLNQLPEGCAFANRCQYKQDQCLKGSVPVSSKDNRSYKCFYPVGGAA